MCLCSINSLPLHPLPTSLAAGTRAGVLPREKGHGALLAVLWVGPEPRELPLPRTAPARAPTQTGYGREPSGAARRARAPSRERPGVTRGGVGSAVPGELPGFPGLSCAEAEGPRSPPRVVMGSVGRETLSGSWARRAESRQMVQKEQGGVGIVLLILKHGFP